MAPVAVPALEAEGDFFLPTPAPAVAEARPGPGDAAKLVVPSKTLAAVEPRAEPVGAVAPTATPPARRQARVPLAERLRAPASPPAPRKTPARVAAAEPGAATMPPAAMTGGRAPAGPSADRLRDGGSPPAPPSAPGRGTAQPAPARALPAVAATGLEPEGDFFEQALPPRTAAASPARPVAPEAAVAPGDGRGAPDVGAGQMAAVDPAPSAPAAGPAPAGPADGAIPGPRAADASSRGGTPGPDPAGSGGARAAPRPGSALGLGVGKLILRLDGSPSRITDRPVETLSGTITGGTAARLTLHANDGEEDLVAERNAFRVAVPLQRGMNRLRVVAVDEFGNRAEESVSVEYVPPAPRMGIAVTAPADGFTLSPDQPPFVVVEGMVDDRTVSTVSLLLNGHRVLARVVDGKFRQVVPVLDTTLRVWAEAAGRDGTVYRSQPVRVLTATPASSLGVLLIDWPREADGTEAQVTVTWRADSARTDVPQVPVMVRTFNPAANGTPAPIFYLKGMRPGVYTFVLRHRAAGASTVVRPTLFIPQDGSVSVRTLSPMSLKGAGTVIVAKVLLPYGVLWDQDDWFSGRSQSSDTVTKFRAPEGITWTERRSDLP
jgi:hypothetical protein